MATDLQIAYKTLAAKRPVYDALFAYYEGDQPLVYTATRLNEIFKDLDAYFAENWCSVVIDAARDRISMKQIQISDTLAAKKWAELAELSELTLESDEVHEAAMVTGEAFVICWENEEGVMEAYANDPRMCHIFYDEEYPRRKKFAAKWFEDNNGFMRITLYYADKVKYYISEKKAENVTSASAFKVFAKAETHPYGEIPVFHFRQARKTKSDLKNVIPIQNGINKLLTDMMVTSEYMAFPQRYIISNAETKGKVKNAPNLILDLPAGDGMGQQTQVGQFAAAELKNYLESIDNLATAISSITRTPKHYFFSIGSNLSGEALIAMEAPLNKKAKDRIDRYIPVWKQVAVFMLKHSGFDNLDPEKVKPVFDRPETIQPRTQAETRELNARAGMPLRSVLREEGKTDEEIKQVMKDADEQALSKANLAKAYLDEARKKFDNGGQGRETPPLQQDGGG